MSMRRAVLGWAACGLVAGACSLAPAPRSPSAHYDFGPQPSPSPAAPIPAVVIVHDLTGPLWLDSANMYYRLTYDDPARVRRFANSQWLASPLQMVGERLRASLAARAAHGGALPEVGVPGDYAILTAIEEFEQIFDDPLRCRGVVRLRVALVRSRGHSLLEQREFAAQEAAPTADAAGGVAALTRAVDRAVAEVTAWVADTTARSEGARVD